LPRFLALIPAVLLILLLAAPSPAHGQIETIETKDLRLIYNDFTQSFLAPHVARCFENSMDFYRGVFHYRPSERVTVLLDDAMDYNNASAWASPRNTLWIQIAPTNRVYETAPSNERINHTMNHELGHIVAQDMAVGSDSFFRKLFAGKVSQTPEHPGTILYSYLTQPRQLSPRWYHEGFAVFLETWMAGGLGRAQGAYDEMVFRSMVKDGSYFYDPVGLESEGTKVDFQAGVNAYLYGTRFLAYLGYEYGPQTLVDWFSRTDGSKKYYTSQFKNVYGRSLDEAWQQWIEWEHRFQEANLDSVRLYPTTPYRDISDQALGSISRAYLDKERNRLYVAVFYPGKAGHIAEIDLETGAERPLKDINGAAIYFVTSLTYDPATGNLFYTNHNYEWRDLCVVNVDSGESHRLIRKARIGDLAFCSADSSLWGVRHYNGISTLVRLLPPYKEWSQVYSPPYGKVIYDIDVSPDGKYLSFSLSEISGRQSLHRASIPDLLNGEFSDEELHDFGNSLPGNFVFSPDGRYLWGSSYYTGISNLWRYDVAADSMDIVTNAETGFFRPVPTGGDSLLALRFTGEGFVPSVVHPKPLEDVSAITFLGTLIAEKYPEVQGWNVGSPADIDLQSKITYEGPYRSFRNLGLASIYPIVEGYKDYASWGLSANVSDPAYVNSIELKATYTFNTSLSANERLHAALTYSRARWEFGVSSNRSDFYDLVGPTKTSRKGQSAWIGYSKRLVEDKPKTLDFSFNTSGWINMERLPYAQNVEAQYDKLWNTALQLEFKNERGSIGGVDHEKGWAWGLNAANNYSNHKTYPLLWGTLDFGVPFLFDHSSIWLRTAAGVSPGAAAADSNSFENFYFGAFGNNYVDYQNVKRYREFYTFPGVEINQISGVNFAKPMLEWNLPPIRFKRIGRTWYYLTYLRPALFASALVTNMENGDLRQTAANVGGQVDLQFSLLSRLKMTLSFGYAVAFEENRQPSDEGMISLKIL